MHVDLEMPRGQVAKFVTPHVGHSLSELDFSTMNYTVVWKMLVVCVTLLSLEAISIHNWELERRVCCCRIWLIILTSALTMVRNMLTKTEHVGNDGDRWTFKGCMGVRRRIDFILCNRCFHSVFGHAVSFLDMGSDHRAVTVCLHLDLYKQTKQDRYKTKRGKQFLHNGATIPLYHSRLTNMLSNRWPINMDDLEKLVLNALLRPSARNLDCQLCQHHRADNLLGTTSFSLFLQQHDVSANRD